MTTSKNQRVVPEPNGNGRDSVIGFSCSNIRFSGLFVKSGITLWILIIGFLWSLLPLPCLASFEAVCPSAVHRSLSGAGIARMDGAAHLWINPAALPGTFSRSLTCDHSRPFGLKELDTTTLSIAIPISNNHLGIGLYTFGFSKYRELRTLFTWSQGLSNHYAIGASLHVASVAIEGLGSTWTVMTDLGMVYQLDTILRWGATVHNIFSAKIGSCAEPLPTHLQTGFQLRVRSQGSVFLDVYKEIKFPLDIRLGFEYTPTSCLTFRMGGGSSPERLCGGVGFHRGAVEIDYAYSTHNVLQATHQASISLAF